MVRLFLLSVTPGPDSPCTAMQIMGPVVLFRVFESKPKGFGFDARCPQSANACLSKMTCPLYKLHVFTKLLWIKVSA